VPTRSAEEIRSLTARAASPLLQAFTKAHRRMTCCRMYRAWPPHAPTVSRTKGWKSQPARLQAQKESRSLRRSTTLACLPGNAPAKGRESCRGWVTEQSTAVVAPSTRPWMRTSAVLRNTLLELHLKPHLGAYLGQLVPKMGVSGVNPEVREAERVVNKGVQCLDNKAQAQKTGEYQAACGPSNSTRGRKTEAFQ